ncbi:mannosyltransferase family protein [Leifsonia sp. NPDC080035]|uniref:Mannosyltransferase family protein n=1 Tax=Leifsonia sp. NPDC080035 TaxID=3143936 RepID=A0AAU7GD90_9MICO
MTAGTTHSVRPADDAARQVDFARIRLFGRDVRWWVAILGMYAASRALTTVLMLALFVAEQVGHWVGGSPLAHPTFFTFSATWDASYYRRIAEDGYPTTLPVDSDGDVQQNPWAFLPLYPLLVRVLMTLTGLGFAPAGVLVATGFGAGAALMLYRVVASRVGATSGFWAAVFFCFGPLSFVLQLAYAESLFFFLMFGALWAMMSRRYWDVLLFGVAAAFTKPGELALPLALGIVFLVRLVRSRRGKETFRRRERAAMIVAGAVTAAAGLAWPLIASAVTGHPDAYVETELSWWTGFIGRVAFVPLTPWFLFTWRYASLAGALLVIAAIVGYVWLLRRPGIKALGIEVTAYAASYALYLFAVFLPQQSLFRLLLPLSPLAGAPGLTQNVRARSIVLAVGVALQPVALLLLWFLGYP